MNTFPVISSIISAIPIGQLVQENYDVGAIQQCKIHRTGINHSYIVSGEDKKYVFRVYSFNWRTELEIQEELRLLLLLREQGLSVSYPVADAEGNFVQKVLAPEGLRYGVLFSYADGSKVRHFTKETSYAIGALMAQVHKVTENLYLERIGYDAYTLAAQPYHFAKALFPVLTEELAFVKQAGNAIAYTYASADVNKLRKGIVHLDMWYDNMHVNGEANITLFDFDFCGNGWLLHDIAYFIMQMFHVEPDKEAYKVKLSAFYAGYESVTSIADEEKRMLVYSGLSIWIYYLGVQAQRFDDWSNFFLTENYLKRYLGMAKEWLSYNAVELAALEQDTSPD